MFNYFSYTEIFVFYETFFNGRTNGTIYFSSPGIKLFLLLFTILLLHPLRIFFDRDAFIELRNKCLQTNEKKMDIMKLQFPWERTDCIFRFHGSVNFLWIPKQRSGAVEAHNAFSKNHCEIKLDTV